MNIFYLDSDPKLCAEYHVDKHVIKMILETCQLLSTAHRVLDGIETNRLSKNNKWQKVLELSDKNVDSLLYKSTHINHPSAIWVRESTGNYNWLCRLLVHLSNEYTYRFGKQHKCSQIGLIDWLCNNSPNNIVISNLTEIACVMPEQYIIDNNPIQSYRNYYRYNKAHLHKWSNRSIPDFILN